MDAYRPTYNTVRSAMTKLNKFLFYSGIILAIVSVVIVLSSMLLKYTELVDRSSIQMILLFCISPLLISLYAKTYPGNDILSRFLLLPDILVWYAACFLYLAFMYVSSWRASAGDEFVWLFLMVGGVPLVLVHGVVCILILCGIIVREMKSARQGA